MSPPAGITTGLAFLPNLLGEANDAATLESLLSGWLGASGWRTAGVIGPADGRESLMLQVRTDGVGMLPAAPSELNDVMRALKSGTPTVVWQLPNSSGRLYTTFQPVGRAAGMIWAERGAGEPWTEADRNYLVLSTKLIERSPALAARIGPPLEPARLQQRLDDVAGIAGRMAHDFNNMLTGIIGYADLSLPLVPAGSQAAKYIAEISKAGHRGIAFTAQVHSYSRSGQTKPQPSSLPAALLKEEQRLRTKTPKPTLAMDLPANLAQVGVEAGQLGVALGHLLDNAIEAGPTDGTVRVSAAAVELSVADAKGYLGPVGPGTHIEIAIRDRGAGIKPEVLAKLFAEPFFTTKARHRGLGLATVYRILHAHAGGIRIESSNPPETGTVVRIVLPPAAARPSAVAPSPRPTSFTTV
jgi:signal transduction histidine kinase